MKTLGMFWNQKNSMTGADEKNESMNLRNALAGCREHCIFFGLELAWKTTF
jgi:hypothetical protein